ncbi:MAG: treY, partial [Naasia sp.]|uniref:malto-oligosyltrehalose synthase n=1 Tax=Naasia sp. TaxID=2546198 RepID=UPI0026069FF7
MTKKPISTYRVQVRKAFDLAETAGIADYVHDLGADWIYFSPVLEAEPGSDHGYDVVNHARVDPERGGGEGLDRAVAAARKNGLGVLIDIVPNHVGVATPVHTRWWWDVLEKGQESAYARAFDIDWDFGGARVRLPVLGSADDLSALQLVEVHAAEGEAESFELRYYDHRFPVAPGTALAGEDPVAVHARQNYELIDWRRADYDLNYRRFFAVNTLAAVRVEVPDVFTESHEEILRWVREGLTDGLRIDHPDGLFDPGRYLDDLAEATGGVYVLVEKILEGDEQLPTSWKTDGTTGYDALADIDRILVDPAGAEPLARLDGELTGGEPLDWHELIHGTKRAVADGILRSEVLRLDRVVADRIDRGSEPSDRVADAIAELLACFPVYRSYLPEGREHLDEAAELAKRHRPDLTATIDALLPVLGDVAEPAARRFQQTSGMVMAKGVEDTAFYRYTRLTSLTEVGADPAEFSVAPDEFHARQQRRLTTIPSSMVALSTHDTKRGEDVRARISVLAEIPEEWATALRELRRLAPLGDGALENLLWQAILGAWPASRERLHAYAEKASREAGDSTTWTEPDEAFENRMHALIDAAFDNESVSAILAGLLERVAAPGWSNSLSAKLLQLTVPGVPDVYQGSELWEMSLVDPDNRRPVDYTVRRDILARVTGGWLPPIDESGAAKLLVTTRALRLRRERPELFTRHAPVEAFGPAAAHVIAY